MRGADCVTKWRGKIKQPSGLRKRFADMMASWALVLARWTINLPL